VLYDDFDPQRRVVRSPAAYGAIWEQPFSALQSAEHRVVSGPSVLVSGDLATATLEFAARLTGGDGKVTGIRTFSSLVWRRGRRRLEDRPRAQLLDHPHTRATGTTHGFGAGALRPQAT
jgi:hypothetical protein